jgi:hypothetical protein
MRSAEYRRVFVGRLLPAIAALAWLGCSGDPAGEEKEVAAACTTDEECPGGKCVAGTCVAIIGATDLTTADAGEPPADSVGPGDGGGTGNDRSEPPGPDSATPPPDSATGPEDTGSVGPKPQDGDPDITVDPLQHMFTYMPGVVNPQTKAVTIFNEGTGSLMVSKIYWDEFSSAEFKFMALPPLPKKILPMQMTQLTVVFQEKAPHGPATLVIESDDPDEPVVSVAFSGQSKTGDEPCIKIEPSGLNFGQVVRGQSKTLPFQVVNCSTKLGLTVNKIERSKFFGMPLTSEFQIDPMPALPLVLAGNEVSQLQVTYTPMLAGLDSGHFIFHNSDPAVPQAKLEVKGVGVPPPLEDIGLHIELEWDTDNCDVDLHLVKPGGTLFDCQDDCYYADMNPDWGVAGSFLDDPFLDYDDVDGYGPENTNLSEPSPGTYLITMHYYNDSYEGFGGGPTNATVRVYSYGVLLQEFGPKSLEYTDKTWDVCKVDWPGANITVIDKIYMAPTQPVCFNW